jgi:hypothetical protein
MLWLIVAALIAGTGAMALGWQQLRERSRCVVHARQLHAWLAGGTAADVEQLKRHARELHDRASGAAAAEAWYALGCALLDARNPEEATRAFQLACHAHPGLESAVLLAFACLRIRGADMPRMLPILLETYEETKRPAIPGSAWERVLLRELRAPDADRCGASPPAQSLGLLPIDCLRKQIADAVADRPAWAGPLLADAPKRKAGTGMLPA